MPPPADGTDAKWPLETASRPLRIPLAHDQTDLLCWSVFYVFEGLMAPEDFWNFVSLYLLDVDMHLEQIARARARRDFDTVAREAHAVARTARYLGALRVSAAAQKLETACRFGGHTTTYFLIGALSDACEEAGSVLSSWLSWQGAAALSSKRT